jgi:hypothetical protein
MVSLHAVEEQLKAIGCNFRFFNRAELRELCHVLLEGEKIANCIGGQYEGGYALLCATDTRVLLVDKKPRFLTLKDIRYEMITELDFNHRLLNATVRVFTPNKDLHFTAWNQRRMRNMFHYIQQKVVETRQHFMMQQFAQPQLMAMVNPTFQLPASNVHISDDWIEEPERPTFIPNQAHNQNQLPPAGGASRGVQSKARSSLAAVAGKLGLKGGNILHQSHQDKKDEELEIPASAEYATTAFRGWRRRIAPYRY